MAEHGRAHDVELSLRKAYLKSLLVLDTPRLFATLTQDPVYFGLLRGWIDHLQLPPARRVLEVGSATGALALHLAQRGHRVTALDRSTRMIERARQSAGHEAVRFLCGDPGDDSLAPNSYDLVLGASILNIVDDPRVLLRQAQRLLSAGGCVAFLFPTRQFSAEGVREYVQTRGIGCASHAVLTVWQAYAARLCPHDAIDWLNELGFQGAQIENFMDGMIAAVSARMAVATNGERVS